MKIVEGKTGRTLAAVGASQDDQALALCAAAKELEDVGEYERAALALGVYWRGVGVRPPMSGLSKAAQAEVLLRAGNLTWLIGRANKVEQCLDLAKNLISESARMFEELRMPERAAEAQTDLGYCYRRAGATEEAAIYFREALKKLEGSNSVLKGVILLRLAAAANQATHFQDALNYLGEAEPIFTASRNPLLLGRFNTSLGMTLEHLSGSVNRAAYLARARDAYISAHGYFKRARNQRFIGFAENNLGLVYLALGDYKQAHHHLKRARQIFEELKDLGLTAEVDETRARVYIAQGFYEVAARLAQDAIEVQERLGQYGEQARALITRGRALARMGNIEWALVALRKARETADFAGDRECGGNASLVLIEEMHGYMTARELEETYADAHEMLRTSQHYEVALRLRDASRVVVDKALSEGAQSEFSPDGLLSLDRPISMRDETGRFEAALIRRAMELSDNKVVRAARLLSLNSHQTLLAMISPGGRHAGIIPEYAPTVQRKSIIRTGGGGKGRLARKAKPRK